jgi:hypothetical protein
LDEPIKPLAVVTDYLDLIAALRRRVVELGTTLTSVDEVAGLSEYYSAHLLSLGSPRKRLGQISMGPLLGALGVKKRASAEDCRSASRADYGNQPTGILFPRATSTL